MHDNNANDAPSHHRRGLFRLARRTAASWSERASNEASSALAPAPGVAEEAGRQGVPEPGEVAAEPRTAPVANSDAPHTEPPVNALLPVEQPSWRAPDAPMLLALMNRKRTTEKRDQVKNIRFTPTAVHIISKAAERRGQKFAGFVGDAALAVALGKGLVGSPEDDPIRPLVEAIETHTVALNRAGNNLNQITEAIHRGTIAEHAHVVLDRVDQAVQRNYRLMDQFVAEGVAHGA
ncbi:hypothetical protein FGW37_09300 [Streptomyces rectiverticillatus]|uniref:hypothetical protein n=1 Tax=Streptomyces rectiverticillatus TaxID=173860 RepID=UPI001FE48FE3|nr:hypothetical protein [Streptomyces rectiverticillatus]QLE71778.1 hypothetical protein FGW37_09300 [Streptomyces rectiverticillatus]